MNNVLAIRMPPPRKRTAEIDASLFAASVRDIRKRLYEYSSISVKTWVHIGNELKGMQERHHNQPGVFRAMFKAKGKEDETRYPFSYPTGLRLIEIAKKFDGVRAAYTLPSSWYILSLLAKLPVDKLEVHLASGDIHPMMTRENAKALVEPKARPKKKSSKAWTTALTKSDPVEKRAEAVFELMARLGLKYDDLYPEGE